MNRELIKLLGTKSNIFKNMLAALSFVLGTVILVLSVHIYLGINKYTNRNSEASNYSEYVFVSKNIKELVNKNKSKYNFTTPEIQEIANQSFVELVEPIVQNKFMATLSTTEYVDFSTLIFFESFNEKHLEQVPADFYWLNGSDFVPVIINNDFVDLYNYGLAISHGLPQVSKSTLTLVPFKLELEGVGGKKTFDAQIVGFSSRTTSVMVPLSFIKWANRTIANIDSVPSNRLLLKIGNRLSPEIESFFTARNYSINTDTQKISKTVGSIKSIVYIVSLLGLFFLILSITILVVSINLSVIRNKEVLNNLIALGYKRTYLARYFLFNSYLYIFIALLLADVILSVTFNIVNNRLPNFITEGNNFLYNKYIIFAILAVFGALVNQISLRRSVAGIVR